MLVDQRTRATVKLVDDPYVVVPSLQIDVACEHKRWNVSWHVTNMSLPGLNQVEYDELDELQVASRLSQAMVVVVVVVVVVVAR